uniref:Uncharacterized protein n=1 Tax=Arundo donax TaxID=35708 RepID=A0A0A9GTM3_ARUDO
MVGIRAAPLRTHVQLSNSCSVLADRWMHVQVSNCCSGICTEI